MKPFEKLQLSYFVLYVGAIIFAVFTLLYAVAEYLLDNLSRSSFSIITLIILIAVTVISYYYFKPFKKKVVLVKEELLEKQELQTEQ